MRSTARISLGVPACSMHHSLPPCNQPSPLHPAGLCCAALLARYGCSVTVCESHYLPGGAAHSFEVQGFKFDAGPSFHAGLSVEGKSSNPLKQVLDVLGEKVDCVTYDQVGL
jgi:phytoene dehydrogenase-like protein